MIAIIAILADATAKSYTGINYYDNTSSISHRHSGFANLTTADSEAAYVKKSPLRI